MTGKDKSPFGGKEVAKNLERAIDQNPPHSHWPGLLFHLHKYSEVRGIYWHRPCLIFGKLDGKETKTSEPNLLYIVL